MKYLYIIIASVLLLTACGTKKSAVSTSGNTTVLIKDTKTYVNRVVKNSLTTDNVTAKIDFGVVFGSKDITVDGKIQMRRNEMIRIMLSPLGLFEVGRLEFTPEEVILIDKMNKQFVRAKYSDLALLRNNGIDFYVLQSLLWNELFVPGEKCVTENEVNRFNTAANNGNYDITLQSGQFKFAWTTDPKDYSIKETHVGYANDDILSWKYSAFSAIDGKNYPTQHQLTSAAKALGEKNISVSIKMGKLSGDAKWDAGKTATTKYRQASVEDILKLVSNM